MRHLLLGMMVVFCGCASHVERRATYSIICEDCRTPYGIGDRVSVIVNKEIVIDRCSNVCK